VVAVDHYTDIPLDVRARLRARMASYRYDDVAEIRRDSVQGRHRYAPDLRHMHFGQGRVCAEVTRDSWTDDMVERGLVYCESGHCLIVPTVCNNVSRITRVETPGDAGGAGVGAGPLDGGGAPVSGPSFSEIAAGEPELPGNGLARAGTAASPDNAAMADAPASPPGVEWGQPTDRPGWGDPGYVFGEGSPGMVLRPGIPGPTPPIPEPGTTGMGLAGLAALMVWLGRRRRSAEA